MGYGYRRSDNGYDEAEYRTVYSDLIEPSGSSQFEVQQDQRLQDLAGPAINRVARAAQLIALKQREDEQKCFKACNRALLAHKLEKNRIKSEMDLYCHLN